VIAILIMLMLAVLAIRTLPVAQYPDVARRRSKSPPPIPGRPRNLENSDPGDRAAADRAG
jgi:hypothetical protein